MTSEHIVNWQQFTEKIRSRGCKQLKELDKFPNSVLITGCQRSGTTILARIIRESEGMVDFWSGKDDELDGALILSGYVNHQPQGRYCFQSTYLNHCFNEYFEHIIDYKILWVLRNPYSTIYSLLYNWNPKGIDNTFRDSIFTSLNFKKKLLYRFGGDFIFNRLKKACIFYNWKISQLFHLFPTLGNKVVKVIDYDELVLNKERILPDVYDFIDLPYNPIYSNKIHATSLEKRNNLSEKERRSIKDYCEDVYKRARELCYV
jgi:hypothetical protein